MRGAGFAEATAHHLCFSKTEGPHCGHGGTLIMRDCTEQGQSAGGTGEPKQEGCCMTAIKKALYGCAGWVCVLKAGFLMCLVDITQRAPGTPGSPQGWVAWGPGQPDLVGGSPAHSRGVELDDL